MTITLDPSDLPGTQTSLGLTKGVANGNIITADSTGLPAIDGSQVTALNAAALTGSIADARLPANLQSFPAPGASGQTLQSDGTNWTAAVAGGGGAIELVSVHTGVTGASDISVTGLSRSAFDAYQIIGNHILPNSNAQPCMQWGTAAGGFLTSAFVFVHDQKSTNGATTHTHSGSSAHQLMGTQNVNTSSPHGCNFNLTWYPHTPGSTKAFVSGFVHYEITGGFMAGGSFWGSHQSHGQYDRFRFFFNGTTIQNTVGKIYVYGWKKS